MSLNLTRLTNEELGLFNPAFCARLVLAAAEEYSDNVGDGLPYPLAFLVVPLAIHPVTRERLPRSIRTSFATWITDNERVRIGLSSRAKALVPFTKAGIRLAIRTNRLSLISSFLEPRETVASVSMKMTDDLEQSLRAASFFGRWFTRSGNPATIFALLGVRP